MFITVLSFKKTFDRCSVSGKGALILRPTIRKNNKRIHSFNNYGRRREFSSQSFLVSDKTSKKNLSLFRSYNFGCEAYGTFSLFRKSVVVNLTVIKLFSLLLIGVIIVLLIPIIGKRKDFEFGFVNHSD